MNKIIILLLCITFFQKSYADIYAPETIKEIKDMAKDIFAKRNPEKTLFIFPLENFILKPVNPAFSTQDENYNALLKKAFSKAQNSKSDYVDELILLNYPHEISDPGIVDLIDYIQQNKSAIIIITPNLTGSINEVNYFDIWTFNYLKSYKIDLSKGVFKDVKFIFDKELKKVDGTYPTFYQGLLSYNTDGRNNSSMQALSVLLSGKLKKVPDVVVAISSSKIYLEALENQIKTLKPDSEFFGLLYDTKNTSQTVISPEDYLKFWQDFVKNLNNVKRKEINLNLENPYEM